MGFQAALSSETEDVWSASIRPVSYQLAAEAHGLALEVAGVGKFPISGATFQFDPVGFLAWRQAKHRQSRFDICGYVKTLLQQFRRLKLTFQFLDLPNPRGRWPPRG